MYILYKTAIELNKIIYPGLSIEVRSTLDFHFSPPKLLYILAETYPAGVPSRTYKTIAQVISAPLFAGLKNPKQANASVTRVIQNT